MGTHFSSRRIRALRIPFLTGALRGLVCAVMKIRPLSDRLVVRRSAEETTTKSGLVIPDTAKEKPLEAEVVAVGPGKTLKDGTVSPLDVRAGEKILFGKYAGTEVKIDGIEHILLREDDVLAVIG